MTQLVFAKVNGWGGKRRGAGRPNRSGRVNHAARPRVDAKTPLHITMRLRPGVASLRTSQMLTKFKECARIVRGKGLRINHFALLVNHLHMIAEANGNSALANGMKSFGGRMGRAVRALTHGRGGVFAGRFHVRSLTSPTSYKRSLRYVLLNYANHSGLIPHSDRYSSARFFRAWAKLVDVSREPLLAHLDSLPVRAHAYLSAPLSWLGRVGWTRAA